MLCTLPVAVSPTTVFLHRGRMKEVVVFIRSMVFLGTQIVSYPMLYQIKQFWPDCRVRVVAQDDVGKHYLSLPWVDAFVRANTLSENYRALGGQADLMIALHFASEKFGLVGLARRPRFRLGFKNGRMTDFVWTHSHRKNFAEYMGLSNMRLLGALKPFDPEIAARQCLLDIAARRHLTPDATDVVLMPGGGAGDYKRWPIALYVALADRLLTLLGPDTTFSFVLGPDEQNEYAWLQGLNRAEFRFAMTRPLPEIAHLVLHARLIVANDCGPTHLAQFACVPYVGVFHEPNREWFWARPYSADVIPRDNSTEIRHVALQDVLDACSQVLQA